MDFESYIKNAKFEVRTKSEETLFNEYELDKWCSFEEFLKTKSSVMPLKEYLTAVEEWVIMNLSSNFKPLPVCLDGEVKLLGSGRLIANNYELILNELCELQKFFDFESIVELGSGLGNNLAWLSQYFPEINFVSREYSPTARRIQKNFLKAQIKNFSIDNFNLYSKQNNLKFENAVCITSYVFSLVKKFPDEIMKSLLNSGIKYVVNIEPLYEVQCEKNNLDAKIKEYINKNNYNTDYYSKLRELESIGKVRILNYKKNKYGINPFFPASVLVWEISDAR